MRVRVARLRGVERIQICLASASAGRERFSSRQRFSLPILRVRVARLRSGRGGLASER